MFTEERVVLLVQALHLLRGEGFNQLTWRPEDQKQLVAAEDELAGLIGRAEQCPVDLDRSTLDHLVAVVSVTRLNF